MPTPSRRPGQGRRNARRATIGRCANHLEITDALAGFGPPKMNEQRGSAGARSDAGALVVAHLELGTAHLRAGRAADAEACFRLVLAAIPTHPDALHLLGAVAIAT